jgi:hypothetical protein
VPWREVSKMDARREFVRLAGLEGANRRELRRRFGIHPDAGSVRRGWSGDAPELADRSRRPHSSPARTAEATEPAIVAIRDAHPGMGARKLAHCVKRDGVRPPAVLAVHEVLRRHGPILPPQGAGSADQRFEKEAANLLWQMDFKGWIRLASRDLMVPRFDGHGGYAASLSACSGVL